MHAAGEAGDGEGRRLGGVADEGEAAGLLEGGVLDPVRAWTMSVELPELAEETFRGRWKRRMWFPRVWDSPMRHLSLTKVSPWDVNCLC